MARQQDAVDDNRLGGITRGSIPGSRKAFVASPRDPSVRVAVREIALAGDRAPFTVYDLSLIHI